jgi:hypothetical protein
MGDSPDLRGVDVAHPAVSDETKAKLPREGIPIDQLSAIQPGMGKIMREVAVCYYYAYYAAKGGNWKLAAYQISRLRGAFRVAKVTRPKYAADLDEFDRAHLVPILKAIQSKEWGTFEAAYGAGIEGSDQFHLKHGHDYIRFTLPEEPPRDLFLGPPGELKRRKD